MGILPAALSLDLTTSDSGPVDDQFSRTWRAGAESIPVLVAEDENGHDRMWTIDAR